jgi:CBS domain-containing protein
MTPAGKPLYPDEPIFKALNVFKGSKDDCLPVVTRETPERLLGVVRRRDVLRLLIRRQSSTS